jgi:hypothetical protein
MSRDFYVENSAEEAVDRNAGQTEKGIGNWARNLKNEKWIGKKGLAVAAATVALGAVIYGGYKILHRGDNDDKQQR